MPLEEKRKKTTEVETVKYGEIFKYVFSFFFNIIFLINLFIDLVVHFDVFLMLNMFVHI